jgi:hypothetical protein
MVRGVLARCIAGGLFAAALVTVPAAAQQAAPEPTRLAIFDPRQPPPPGPSALRPSRAMSERELVRWAIRELRGWRDQGGRARPPLPPNEYRSAQDQPGAVIYRERSGLLRVLGELGLGILGAGLGGGAGLFGLWLVEELQLDRSARLMAGLVTAGLATVGTTAGVLLGGSLSQGEGRPAETFLFQVLGTLLALPLVVWSIDEGREGIGLAAGATLPVLGAVVGYELSHAAR